MGGLQMCQLDKFPVLDLKKQVFGSKIRLNLHLI